MSTWFDDEEFWKALEPFLFVHKRPKERTAQEVRGLIRLLKLKKKDRVLDLCCGTGRVALALARRGHRVTGVDRTRYYLVQAHAAARREGLKAEWVRQDMRGFKREGCFEAAINMFSSFGYFEDPNHDRHVLENLFASLKPGGRLLLDLAGREVLKRRIHTRIWYYDEPTETYLLESSRIKPRWDWVENRYTLIKGKKQTVHTFGLRIYSGKEIKEALLKAGFSTVTLFGDFEGSPYNRLAERLLAVAKKGSGLEF